METTIRNAQKLMQDTGLDGWLLYDFRHSNSLAIKFLQIPHSAHLTRRFCYFIPQRGDPVKIVHAVEENHLNHLPGRKECYTTWESFHEKVQEILMRGSRIALEYSKNGAIPYVSKVDAGFMELVRSFGIVTVSSQDLLQHFTAVLTNKQCNSHKEAALFLEKTAEKAFSFIEEAFRSNKTLKEKNVQDFMLMEFLKGGFHTESPPMCAFGENSANPHYEGGERPLKKGDPILLDLWCKKKKEDAIYADITKMAFAGRKREGRFQEVFHIVKETQKEAISLVLSKIASGIKLHGFEVDDIARSHIEKEGYGPFFVHRTGHNIHTETHGDGANMDNFETHDDREILLGTCFSIEPGIYLKGEFGVRLECNVLVHFDRTVEITGGIQEEPRWMDI